MIAHIRSVAISGLTGHPIDVEVDIANGLPSFTIVGLGDAAVQESKERIRSAIKNSGFAFPAKRITVNLAPADIRKKGPGFDLPIAVGMLANAFEFDPNILSGSLFLGELSLDGNIRGVSGALPSVIFAKENGYGTVFLPRENFAEASVIPDIRIVPVDDLRSLASILSGDTKIPEEVGEGLESVTKHLSMEGMIDFSHIVGQSHAKRALLIAASGGHNILLEGPPGSGKTMLARALATILPDMEFSEVVETSKIYSVAGLLSREHPLVLRRPFRKVHHTASIASIIGGGRDSRPGEISLAHKGILFLDEFLEFDGRLLETLRQPLEDGEITVNRVNASYRYPAKFTLVGALNPCPCGFLGDREKDCVCSSAQIERYRSKLSGPILDRIDLFVNVPRIKADELSGASESSLDSASIKKQVEQSRTAQKSRFRGTAKTYNAEMDSKDIELWCALGKEESEFMKNALSRLNLSTRAYFRILRVARTIADLEGSEHIRLPHLAEAVGYREKTA